MTIKAFSNSKGYGVRIRARCENLNTGLKKAMGQTADALRDEAVRLSSGPYGHPATLRKLGHPYSRRAPRSVGNEYPAMLNINRGALRRGWYTRMIYDYERGGITVVLRNDLPYTRYLTAAGTRRMIGRPTIAAITKNVLKTHRENVRRAVREAVAEGYRGNVAPVTRADTAGAFLRGFQSGFNSGINVP